MLNESLARRYSIALYASAKAKGEESLQLKELRIVQEKNFNQSDKRLGERAAWADVCCSSAGTGRWSSASAS